MSTEHTPGPWTAYGSSVWSKAANGQNKNSRIVANTTSAYPDSADKDNARLIAACPELLQTSRTLLAVLIEAGIMDVDEWKAWKRKAEHEARCVLAGIDGEE